MIESICLKNKTSSVNIFCQGVAEFLLFSFQKSLNNEQPIDTTDPHVPANLLKNWLWDLPKPLIPISLIENKKLVEMDKETRYRYLNSLPLANKDVISELFEFFLNCSQWESFTKVNLKEICKQFTPCIFHCKKESNKTIFECLMSCEKIEFALLELFVKETDFKSLKSKRDTSHSSFILSKDKKHNFSSPFVRNKTTISIPKDHQIWSAELDTLKNKTWAKYNCGNCGKEAPNHSNDSCPSCNQPFYCINKEPINLLLELKKGYQFELGNFFIFYFFIFLFFVIYF